MEPKQLSQFQGSIEQGIENIDKYWIYGLGLEGFSERETKIVNKFTS